MKPQVKDTLEWYHRSMKLLQEGKHLLLIAHISNGRGAEYGSENCISKWADWIPTNDVEYNELPDGICFFDEESKYVSPDSSDDYLHVVADSAEVLSEFIKKHNFDCIAWQYGKVVELNLKK
jgi:hypothetical protein